MVALLVGLLAGAGPNERDLFQEPRAGDVPQLVAALKDPNLRQGAVVALAKVGKPAVRALIAALGDPNADLRLWAAFALGHLGPQAGPAVAGLTRAAGDEDGTLRAVAVESLGKIGPEARAAIPILVRTLKDREPGVRQRSALALGRIRPDGKEAILALVEAIRDEPARQAAVEALVRIGKPSLPVLIDALADNDLRLDATEALRQIDPGAATRAGVDRTTAADLPALARAVTSANRSADSRRRAAAMLGQLGAEAVPALTAVLGDEAVRQSAVEALGTIGKPAVIPLAGKLKDAAAATRESAALALGRLGADAREAVPALAALLQDRDRDVRRAVCVALEAIGPDAERAVPALVKVLRSKDAEPVQLAAIKALVRAGPEAKADVVAALLAAIKEGNYGVKTLAGSALKKVDAAAAEKAGVR